MHRLPRLPPPASAPASLTPSCIPGGTKGKTGMAVKMLIFSTVGWGLPFFAWKYSEYKVNNN